MYLYLISIYTLWALILNFSFANKFEWFYLFFCYTTLHFFPLLYIKLFFYVQNDVVLVVDMPRLRLSLFYFLSSSSLYSNQLFRFKPFNCCRFLRNQMKDIYLGLKYMPWFSSSFLVDLCLISFNDSVLVMKFIHNPVTRIFIYDWEQKCRRRMNL